MLGGLKQYRDNNKTLEHTTRALWGQDWGLHSVLIYTYSCSHSYFHSCFCSCNSRGMCQLPLHGFCVPNKIAMMKSTLVDNLLYVCRAMLYKQMIFLDMEFNSLEYAQIKHIFTLYVLFLYSNKHSWPVYVLSQNDLGPYNVFRYKCDQA